MSSYKKRPVSVQAFRLGLDAMPDWFCAAVSENRITTHNRDSRWSGGPDFAKIHTLEGVMQANYGDWVIQGVQGEIYPCKPDIFAITYEPDGGAPATPREPVKPKSKIHTLKTWPRFYAEVIAGRKKFELRYNDRGFEVGDCLVLQEFDPSTDKYTGEMSSWRVLYMMPATPIGSHVVMSIEPWEVQATPLPSRPSQENPT